MPGGEGRGGEGGGGERRVGDGEGGGGNGRGGGEGGEMKVERGEEGKGGEGKEGRERVERGGETYLCCVGVLVCSSQRHPLAYPHQQTVPTDGEGREGSEMCVYIHVHVLMLSVPVVYGGYT